MTNKDKLIEDLQNADSRELNRVIDSLFSCNCCVYGINECLEESNCTEGHAKWLEQEYKEPIKLTETESVILKNIDKKYQWIVRDGETNRLYIYVDKPRKYDNLFWQVGDYDMSVFNHLFKCIKGTDEEPYNIEELLKGAENG